MCCRILLTAILLLAINCTTLALNNNETNNNVSATNTSGLYTEYAASQLMQEVNTVYWESATAYRKFGDDTFSPEILMRQKLRPFYAKMQNYNWRHFKDPLLRRQFEVILRGAKYPPINHRFRRATHKLATMSRGKWTCSKDQHFKCNMAFIHQIKSIITNSDDLEEIKYYWAEWRNKMQNEVKHALQYYIEYYKNLTTPNLSAAGVWYEDYEDANLLQELENIIIKIQPFYKQIQAHLRYLIISKYGNNTISKADLIPHHLFEQITYQAWKKNSLLKDPFPANPLPNIQTKLDEFDYYPFDLVNISAQFYGSMGFQNLSDDFIRDHIVEMEAGTAGSDCRSIIFDYAEIEMNYCPKVNYKKLLQTHGDMALIQYAIAKNNRTVGLNQQACPGFGNAIGEAAILSVSNPKHLLHLQFIENYEKYDDYTNLNRLYRMALHTTITTITNFVHEKLWVDMISGTVEPLKFNEHYWWLMEEYLGVEAPLKTNSIAYDMPYKFYEGIVDQFRTTRKIVGEFLGYQIYANICQQIGEFKYENADTQLDMCDFTGHKRAGELLISMMSAGSTKTWRELIQPLTNSHDTNLTANAFLQYYEPINNWLTEDNRRKHLSVGWKHSNFSKLLESLRIL